MTVPKTRRDAPDRLDPKGWLRAAVLGANDGLVSTASLLLGVATAGTSEHNILLTGVAGLVAGATSMAAGEYVSVHAQADEENADRMLQRTVLPDTAEAPATPASPPASSQSAGGPRRHFFRGPLHGLVEQRHAPEASSDALNYARPLQAALASAISFSVGAAAPLIVTLVVSGRALVPWIASASLLFLALLGFIAADAGRANRLVGTLRVTLWGAIAMAVTAGVGMIFKPMG